jgi:hypothetical protein
MKRLDTPMRPDRAGLRDWRVGRDQALHPLTLELEIASSSSAEVVLVKFEMRTNPTFGLTREGVGDAWGGDLVSQEGHEAVSLRWAGGIVIVTFVPFSPLSLRTAS